jgi:hypothetical protein
MDLLLYVCSTYRLALDYSAEEVEELKADLARWSSSLHRNLPALVDTMSARLKLANPKLETWLEKIGDDASPERRVYHATRGLF